MELRERLEGLGWDDALRIVVEQLSAQIGTIHTMEADGMLHLRAHTPGIPEPVLAASRVIPVGKGIAGQAVLQKQPVNLCNLQTDSSGTVPEGAKATAAMGSICVPMLRDGEAVGALGVAVMSARTWTPAEEDLLLAAGKVLAQRVR